MGTGAGDTGSEGTGHKRRGDARYECDAGDMRIE